MKEHWNRIHNKSNNQLPPSQPSSEAATAAVANGGGSVGGDAASSASPSGSIAASPSALLETAGEKVGNASDANSSELGVGVDADGASREQKAKFVPKVIKPRLHE